MNREKNYGGSDLILYFVTEWRQERIQQRGESWEKSNHKLEVSIEMFSAFTLLLMQFEAYK